MVDIGRKCAIGWKRASPQPRLPGQHVKFLSVMSFYSLWQHYISMTSQPLANSDRGVMRIVGITELMHHPRLSPFSLSLIMPFFTFRCHSPTSQSHSLHLLFSPPCCHSYNSHSSPLFSFHLLLVPHLVILEHHSPYRSLKSSLIFPSRCLNTLSKWLR